MDSAGDRESLGELCTLIAARPPDVIVLGNAGELRDPRGPVRPTPHDRRRVVCRWRSCAASTASRTPAVSDAKRLKALEVVNGRPEEAAGGVGARERGDA
jgi:hypothetical protein